MVDLEPLGRQIGIGLQVGVGADDIIDLLLILNAVTCVIEERNSVAAGVLDLAGETPRCFLKSRVVRVAHDSNVKICGAQFFGNQLGVGDCVGEHWERLVGLDADHEGEPLLGESRRGLAEPGEQD